MTRRNILAGGGLLPLPMGNSEPKDIEMAFRTDQFEAYIAPARAHPQIWRIVVGVIVTVAMLIGWIIVSAWVTVELGWVGMNSAELDLNTRPSMIEGLLGFSGGIIGLWIVVRFLHRRSFGSLLGSGPVARHFLIAAGVVAVINGSWLIASAFVWGTIPNVAFASVLIFLPLGAALLLIQTGAEEFLFRGYLMQQLAARFASPIIWFVLPAVTFGLIHYDPASMGDMIWPIIASLTLTGLAWADLTRITGNIGAAWGWHFMNNFLLLNFFTLQGSLTGFAWKVTPFGPEDLTLIYIAPDFVFTVLSWWILRRILRPKFQF